MQEAIPYRPWQPLTTHTHIHNNNPSFVSPKMVLENAVIVFGRRGCCMSHVVKRLLLGLGVNPAVHEVEEKDEVGVVRELEAIVGPNNDASMMQFPAVFIGGKLFGGLDRLMATHISGELVPILKQAGALWL
ncbi:Glutaredoxin-C9, partial [Mucuna pruriens]